MMHIHKFKSVCCQATRHALSHWSYRPLALPKPESVSSLCAARLMSIDSGGSDSGPPPERIPRAGKTFICSNF